MSVAEALRFQRLEARVARLEGLLSGLRAILAPRARRYRVIRAPGGDHIDWPAIVKALKDIRYDGDVVIESFTQDVKVIARAAAIWRRIEPTRDEIAVKGVGFLRRTFAI